MDGLGNRRGRKVGRDVKKNRLGRRIGWVEGWFGKKVSVGKSLGDYSGLQRVIQNYI